MRELRRSYNAAALRRGPLFYVTHWYTFRTVVGVVLALLIAGAMFWLYTQPARVPFHPEDRLLATDDPPDPNVVIVGIDDRSIAGFGAHGEYPFKRDRYATVLDNLKAANAAVAAFDIQFSEDSTPAGDDAFATAIGQDKLPVVLAYGQSDLQSAGPGLVRMKNTGAIDRPLDKFVCGNPKALPGCKPVAQLGSTAIINDPDKIVRLMPMFVQTPCLTKTAADECIPGVLNPISFVAYRQLVAGTSLPLTYTTQGAYFGAIWTKPLWTDDHGLSVIDYQGGPSAEGGWFQRHRQYLSFGDVYYNKFDRLAVAGKIVLIGSYSAAGVHDEQQTPSSNGAVMPGVELQAAMIQTLNSINQSKFLQPEPASWILASLLILCLLLGVLLPRLPAHFGLALTIGAILAYTGGWLLLQAVFNFGLVPNLLEVWLALGLTYAGLMAYRFLYEEREKRKVKSIFGLYLKPELVDELSRSRSLDEIPLGGERREISLLFVDIRGFTSMSEGMDAEDVLKVLDVYLEDLSRIVFKWDGTLDKYVGDEIMAIWNAPAPQADHALNAVRCAWEMVMRMPEVNERLQARGLPEVQYGIGVNSGPASVGQMGSQNRRTYTAIGDTVNTAARFCGAAGPTQILIGQSTRDLVQDYVAVDVVPGLQLKGKSAEKFTVYRITAIRESPGSPWVTAPGLKNVSEAGVDQKHSVIGAEARFANESEPITH